MQTTVQNVAGIMEFVEIAGLREAHPMGLILHSTEPISEEAFVHLCALGSLED